MNLRGLSFPHPMEKERREVEGDEPGALYTNIC